MTLGQASIIEHDMEPWLLQECIDCALYALHNFNDEDSVAEFIKKEFDLKYEPSWHVIVGQSFGVLVGHEIRKCAYFSVGNLFFLIYKSPEPEVPYIDGNAPEDEEMNEEEGDGEAAPEAEIEGVEPEPAPEAEPESEADE